MRLQVPSIAIEPYRKWTVCLGRGPENGKHGKHGFLEFYLEDTSKFFENSTIGEWLNSVLFNCSWLDSVSPIVQ